jgi:hypothetical protein
METKGNFYTNFINSKSKRASTMVLLFFLKPICSTPDTDMSDGRTATNRIGSPVIHNSSTAHVEIQAQKPARYEETFPSAVYHENGDNFLSANMC